MKHILCIIGQLGNGGSEKQLYLFLKYLDKKKYSASVFVTGSGGGIWAERISKNLGIQIIFTEQASIFSKIAYYRQELQSQKPDVIFSWSFFTNPLGCISKGIRFVGSLRQQFSYESTDNLGLFRCWLAKKPVKIVVNSNYIYNQLLETNLRPEKLKVIFNIFETDIEDEGKSAGLQAEHDFFKQYDISQDAVIVMGIGRNSSAKNFPFFVDVIETAKKKLPEIHGVLVGSGGTAIWEDIENRGLSDSFTITGEVPSAQKLLKMADIFFLSSRKEGLANVLIEAVHAGCASLATDVGGVRDVFHKVPDDLLGKILIKTGDVDLAAEMLVDLASDVELRTQVVDCTSGFIAELAPEKIMQQYYEVLFPN